MSDAELTRDAFLGGRVQAWQPRIGYRAATDPVILAAATMARPGETVLELGCGVGVASLCLAARVPGLQLTGVERQAAYADLARRNAAAAGAAMQVHCTDISALPPELRQQSFDHVIANPPYYPAGGGTEAADAGRAAALREDTPLSAWVATAQSRLTPKGWLTLILAMAQAPAALAALSTGFGALSMWPLQARSGRAPGRFLLRARKGAATPFRLLPPLVIHRGDRHVSDGDDYTETLRAVLRDGAGLDWPDGV